jgi:hypothetical protein
MNARTLAIATLLFVTGCGGGAGGSAPAAAPSAAPVALTGAVQTGKVILSFPVATKPSAARRGPTFVDPTNSTTLVTIINMLNGNPALPPFLTPYKTTTVSLMVGGSCSISGNIETCTATIPAPAGSVNYTFNVTDGTHVLSTVTVDETLVAGSNNIISGVTLQGVLGSVNLSVGTLTGGSAGSGPVGVTVNDPGGAAITGNTTPFSASSVTLTSSTTHFKLSVGNGPFGASVVITGPGDAQNVTYSYDGAPQAAHGITLTATATTGGAVLGTANFGTINALPTFTGLTTADTAHGANSGQPNYNGPTEFFTATLQTQSNVTAAEAGFTSPPASQSLVATPDPACGTIVASVSVGAPAGPPGNEALTIVAGSTAGICKIDVSDGLGDTAFFWVSVSSTSFGVQ